jgi:hypothetical protein
MEFLADDAIYRRIQKRQRCCTFKYGQTAPPHRDGETRTIWLDAKVPKADFDTVVVRFWNAGGDKKMLINNLLVQTFNIN